MMMPHHCFITPDGICEFLVHLSVLRDECFMKSLEKRVPAKVKGVLARKHLSGVYRLFNPPTQLSVINNPLLRCFVGRNIYIYTAVPDSLICGIPGYHPTEVMVVFPRSESPDWGFRIPGDSIYGIRTSHSTAVRYSCIYIYYYCLDLYQRINLS